MRLHTLGPRQTDSYAYPAGRKIASQIILHDSFAAIYNHLIGFTGDRLPNQEAREAGAVSPR